MHYAMWQCKLHHLVAKLTTNTVAPPGGQTWNQYKWLDLQIDFSQKHDSNKKINLPTFFLSIFFSTFFSTFFYIFQFFLNLFHLFYLFASIREYPKGAIIGACDIWDTDYNSDNWEPEFMTICVLATPANNWTNRREEKKWWNQTTNLICGF